MKHPISKTLLAAMIIVPGAASASHGYYEDDDMIIDSEYVETVSNIEYAKVTDVDPIVEYIKVAKPHRECREQVVHVNGYKNRSATPALFGGIIGGAVGNHVGKGKGRQVATLAGALLGASIGNDIRQRNNYRTRGHNEVQTSCYTVNDYIQKRKVTGYNVSYRYHGQTYTTVMDHHPGKRIKVQVAVSPLD